MPQDMRIPELLLDAPNVPGTDSPYPPEPQPSGGKLAGLMHMHGDRKEEGRFRLPRMVGSLSRDAMHQTILEPSAKAAIRKLQQPQPQQMFFPPARPGEPQQVAPAPLPPQQQPMRSVLKR
jgi:hypothetical protein